jgi:HEAT repeat protein
VIKDIARTLEEDGEMDEESFLEFISFLDHTSIDSLMEELAQAEKIRTRRLLIKAISLIGGNDIQRLIKWLDDDRWYVVRNVAVILGNIRDTKALVYLGKILSHPDRRVRKEAINAIGKIGSPEAVKYLEEGLRDIEQQVRVSAVKALSNIKTKEARDLILKEMASRSFIARDLSEKKEFFASLASWNDKEVRDFLISVLKKKSIFKRSKIEENRLCAAYALGLMDDREAIPVLKRFQSSKNIYLKRISLEALKRLSA